MYGRLATPGEGMPWRCRVTSTVKRTSPVVVELSVEVPEGDVKQALDKAYNQLRREARISGFRKGKAPRAVLKRMFGSAIRTEVRGELVSRKLIEALKEHELEPIAEPNIEAGDLEEGGPYSFSAVLEVRPRLEAVDIDEIEVESYKIAVADDEVAAGVERLRSNQAEVIDLDEPRPAAEGDLVKFTLKQWASGEWHDAPWPEQEAVLGEGRLPPRIEEALQGITVGEEKVVDFGSDTEMEESRSRFMLTVASIHERRLPDLDDEFAKDLGDFETMDDLREDVQRQIREAKEEEEQSRLRQAVFKALREKNPIELPPTLLQNQTMAMKMRLSGSMAALGDGALDEEKQKEILDGAEETAKETLHHHLLLTELARLEGLEISEADLEEELVSLAERRGIPLPKLKADLDSGERREELRANLLERKVFDLVRERVKIVEVDPPEPEAGADDE